MSQSQGGHSLVYITAGSRDEAMTIARDLVDSRLAACCNVLGEITSVFHWEGRVQDDTEVALIAKTRGDLVDELIRQVRSQHSYDCPAIIAMPIEKGNPMFLEWIGKETV